MRTNAGPILFPIDDKSRTVVNAHAIAAALCLDSTLFPSGQRSK